MSVGSVQGDGLQQFLLRRLPERFSGETFRFASEAGGNGSKLFENHPTNLLASLLVETTI